MMRLFLGVPLRTNSYSRLGAIYIEVRKYSKTTIWSFLFLGGGPPTSRIIHIRASK